LRAAIDPGFKEDDDVVIYRFLRGYQFEHEKASAALNAMLQFRKKYNLDEVRVKVAKMTQKDFPHYTEVMKGYPHNIEHGVDKKGQPVGIERLGLTKPALLTKLVSLDELLEYHLYHLEHKALLTAELTERKGVIMRNCKIVELGGLGAAHLSSVQGLKYLKTLLTVGQANYPEMAGNVYFVNAPFLLSALWTIVKPWFQPATLEKIRFLGNDYKTKLLEEIDADQLPTFLGGTCTCSDKGGCVADADLDEGMTKATVFRSSFLNVPVEVTASHFDSSSSSTSSSPSTSTSTSASSPRRSSLSLGASLAGPEAYISWEFRSNKDLDFEVLWSPPITPEQKEVKPVVVLKKARVNSHEMTITGEYLATTPGLLTLVFDNSYSMMTAKNLVYRVEVIKRGAGSLEAAIEAELDKRERDSVTGPTSATVAVEGEPTAVASS